MTNYIFITSTNFHCSLHLSQYPWQRGHQVEDVLHVQQQVSMPKFILRINNCSRKGQKLLTSVIVPTVFLDGDLVPDDAVGAEVTLVFRSFGDQENQFT